MKCSDYIGVIIERRDQALWTHLAASICQSALAICLPVYLSSCLFSLTTQICEGPFKNSNSHVATHLPRNKVIFLFIDPTLLAIDILQATLIYQKIRYTFTNLIS